MTEFIAPMHACAMLSSQHIFLYNLCLEFYLSCIHRECKDTKHQQNRILSKTTGIGYSKFVHYQEYNFTVGMQNPHKFVLSI